jgi:uracil-DNA glycosylase family 4
MDAADKAAALAELAEQIARCPDCELSRTRTRAVPGEGRPDADIVLIGEGPGYYEDQQARPFVGPAGHFLEQLLASIGLRRGDVYIGNVIKCRPPDNRDPLPQEISACRKWLDRQLEIIQPKLVVTLGRYSMNRYVPGQSIGRVRAQPRRLGDLVVVPFYHPAAALHQGSLRRTIEEDFKKLPAILEQALKEEPRPAALEPEQMRLL